MKRFNRWLNKTARILLGVIFVWSLGVSPAQAEECECFCGDEDLGALSAGPFESGNECAQFCSDVGTSFSTAIVYVGCYTDESMYPENNNLCWTADECGKYPIEVVSTTYYGDFGGQSAYCGKKPVSGEAMGYCYGPLIPVVLNVPILGVTQVGTLGEYVNLIYTYGLPASAMFAALMFTIAGFQYMTAGGDKSAVSKAKGRMVNTVTGIILLMSVYTIAYLIDPRLTRFNELRPPLVKKAVMIDDSTSCEALFDYGYCISGTCPGSGTASGECGEKGEITGDDSVELNIANPPEVGDDCMFSHCEDNSQACVLNGDNSGGTCAACNDVSSINPSLDLVPSSSTCAQISARAQREETNPDHLYSCYFDNDLSGFSEADGLGADECVQLYTSGDEYIDCNALRDIAVEEEDGCDAYEYVNADSYGLGGSGNVSELFNQGSADEIEDFKNVFGQMCEQDVCNIADTGTVPQGSCNFGDSAIWQDLLDAGIGGGIFTIFDDYACAGSVTLNPPASDESSFGDEYSGDYSPSTF